MSATVLLGYEVASGAEVCVPLKHLAITGQTQESGKTTTLEALAARSGETVIAFVTKRGERSFASARRVAPYFRDRADWQFVTSIIDATLQEKNKFLRPWIMKVCRTTRTLAEVQTKVRDALRSAKGINEGVYTQLDAYLDLIVPEIARAQMASSLDLAHGELNVIDVSSFATPMQMLFVQSALDWVNDRKENTIVVIPEAWEFIPEGKGSPAKSSAVTLVRKGAAIGNHIWVDSQDMAGVDKVILRGCAVWLIGVQREANEIKRNLSNIPSGIKRPTAAAVAQLERGQFYACWSDKAVKAYVRPAWMEAEEARSHALGLPVDPEKRAMPPIRSVHTITEDRSMNAAEARALQEENERLHRRIAELEDTARRFAITMNTMELPNRTNSAAHADSSGIDIESLYNDFRDRLLNEPVVLRIAATKPEIEVGITRRVIDANDTTLFGRIAMLIVEGFFDETTSASAAYVEFQRRAFATAKPNVYRECDRIAAQGFLTKEDGGYRAVQGMKINIVERE